MTTSEQGSRIPSDADKEIRMVNLGSTTTTNVQPKKREIKPKPRPIISNHDEQKSMEKLESTTRNVHAKKRGRPPKARPVPMENLDSTGLNVEPKRRKRPPKVRPVEAVARLAEATVPKPESSKGKEHLATNGENLAKKGSGEVRNFDFSEEGRRSKALVLDNERGRSSYTENKLQEYEGTGLLNDIISGKQGPLNLRNDDPISRKSTRVDDSVVPDQGGVIVESGPSALMGNSELPIDVEEEDIDFQKLLGELQEEETDFQMTGTDTLQPLWDLPDIFGGSSSNQPPSTLSAGHSLMTQPPSNLSSSHSVMAQPISISDYGQPSQGSQTVGMSPQPERRSLVGSSMGQENYSTTGPISNYPGPPNLGFGHQPSSVLPNHFSTQPTIAQQNQLVPPIPENQPNFFSSQPFGRETQTNFPIGGSSQNQPALGQVMGWNQPTLDALPYLYTNGGASQTRITPGSSYMYGSSSQSGGQAILEWNQNQSFPYSHSSVGLGQNQTGSVSKAKNNSRRRSYRKTRLSVMEQVGPTYGMNMDQIREFYSKLQSQQRMQFQPMFPMHPPMQLQPQSQSQVPSQQQSQSQFQPLLPLQLPLQPLLQVQSQPRSQSQLQQLFSLQPPMLPQYQSQSQSQPQYQLQSQTRLQPQFSLQPPMQPQYQSQSQSQPQYQLQPQTQLQPPIQPQLELQPQSQTHFSQPQQHQIGSAPLINEAANLGSMGGAQYQLQSQTQFQPSIRPQLELQPQSESHFYLPQQHQIGSAPLINEAVNLGPTGGVNPYGYEEFPMQNTS